MTGCRVSDRSHEMGPLPAWQGDQVHIALPREAPDDAPDQLWVGIPGAGAATTFTVSARRLDGPGVAEFHLGPAERSVTTLTVRDGMRTATGYPPHWGLRVSFSDPGCWAVRVTTDTFTDTVTLDVSFDRG